MIEQRAVPVTSIITICNYKSFQGIEGDDDTTEKTCNDTTDKHLTNIRQTSDDTQTNKGRSPDNGNHENNENKEMILKDLWMLRHAVFLPLQQVWKIKKKDYKRRVFVRGGFNMTFSKKHNFPKSTYI